MYCFATIELFIVKLFLLGRRGDEAEWKISSIQMQRRYAGCVANKSFLSTLKRITYLTGR